MRQENQRCAAQCQQQGVNARMGRIARARQYRNHFLHNLAADIALVLSQTLIRLGGGLHRHSFAKLMRSVVCFFGAFAVLPMLLIVRKPIALAHVLMGNFNSLIGGVLAWVVPSRIGALFISRAHKDPGSPIA